MFLLSTIHLAAPVVVQITKREALTLTKLELCFQLIGGNVYAQIARIPNAMQIYAGTDYTADQCANRMMELLGNDLKASLTCLANAEGINGAAVIPQKDFTNLMINANNP